jgi:hypothetical protein
MLRYEYSCPINSKQPVQVCRAERLIQPAYLHRSANQLDCDPSAWCESTSSLPNRGKLFFAPCGAVRHIHKASDPATSFDGTQQVMGFHTSLSFARRLGSNKGVPSTNNLVALSLLCSIVPRRSCDSSCRAGSRSPSVAVTAFAQSTRIRSSILR